MRAVFFTVASILLLFPASNGFSAELSDTFPSLTVLLENNPPFVYRDDEGYTVVVGQVMNNDEIASVTNVQISVNFYDDAGTRPLESSIGSTVLDVIPPSGFSPYVIKSPSTNPAITQVSVDLEGFDPSPPKLKQLQVQDYSMSYADDTLYFYGILKNGATPISETNVYAAFYDGFDPPRMVAVHTIPLGQILPNESVPFDFNERIDPRAMGFYLFSESDIFYSDFVNLQLPEPDALTKLVTIKNVMIKDSNGDVISEIPVGSKINIQSDSWIRFSSDQPSNEAHYTYYVQVKRFGDTPYVEFLDKYDGKYIGVGPQSPSVDWVPENKGEFFIETYIWDEYNVPISDPGPFALISVK